jgi:hypothetical protein
MNITLVPPGHVAGVIPALLPYLHESQEWTRGRALVDDLLRLVLTGEMQLWVVFEGDHIFGHVITEIKPYPRCKMLTIQYCAMETGTLDEINEKMQDVATRFAKDAGCAGIEFVGRPGWRATAREYGYTVQSVMYQKFFEEAP